MYTYIGTENISLAEVDDLSSNCVIFETVEINEDVADENIDPDVNYWSASGDILYNCKYYLEDSFNHLLCKYNNKTPGLSLLHHNVRNSQKNLDSFSHYLINLDVKFSIIGLSETWLSDSIKDLYKISGYNSVHLCREGRGGGVSLYIDESLEFHQRLDLSLNKENIECLFIEMSGRPFDINRNVIIGVIYRPPNTDMAKFNDELSNILSDVSQSGKVCYCMGDYNINLLNNRCHSETGHFLDLMYANSFLPLINRPTRITDQSSTIIDNIFCNNLSICPEQASGLLYTDLSDHLPVFVVTFNNVECNRTKVVRKRICGQNNISEMKGMLECHDWDDVITVSQCQEAYSKFDQIVSSCYDATCPFKSVTLNKKNNKPWVTKGMKKSIKQKNKLYHMYKTRNTVNNEIQYKRYRCRLQHLLRGAKKSYYQRLLGESKSNLKKSWSVMREIIGNDRHTHSNKQFIVNNQVVDDKVTIVNAFNDLFVNLGPSLARDIPDVDIEPDEYLKGNYVNSFFAKPVSEEEILAVIKRLKNSSPGLDGISAHLIKSIGQAIVKPLSHIVNLSFSQGIFPSQLKKAYVIPIYKGGDSQLLKNYRPVSVLPVFSKIFESLMYDRLKEYITEHNILYEHQFGFRKGHSTQVALTVFINKVMNALDNSQHVIGIFLDLAKAFDTVNHSILLKKLWHYGVRGEVYDWFQSYLSGRSQIVKFNDQQFIVNSDERDITCGVPQGSILGPLLFLLYVNDLSTVSDIMYSIMFADDTNMFAQGNDICALEKIVDAELGKVVKWLYANKLSLNVDKSHCMLFSFNRHHHTRVINVHINGVNVETVTQTKFLGILIDNKLCWSPHIDYISAKIAKGIGIIKKVKFVLSRDTLLSLYYTFVYPYLCYCNVVWGRAAKLYLSRLHVLQKRILRVICNVNFLANSDPLFKSCNVMTIYDINTFCTALLMFKAESNMLPSCLSGIFKFQSDIHTIHTRQAHLFHLPFCRTEKKKKSVSYYGPYIWNNFVLRYCTVDNSISVFKKSLRSSLCSHSVPL